MSQWNETSFSLHVENTKHEKYFFFQLAAFLLPLTVSVSQRSYTSLFQHVKLCVTIHRRRAILPQTQICKFRRTKFDTVAPRGPDLFNYTSSSDAFFLTQCEKSTVVFPPTRPCNSFAEL